MMMELSNLLKITLLILICCIYIFLLVPSSIEGEESKIKNVQSEIRRRLIPKRKLPPKANTIKANGTIIGPPVGAEGPRVRQKSAVQRIRNTTTVDLPSLFKKYVLSFGPDINDASLSSAYDHLTKFPATSADDANLPSLSTLLAEGANHPEIKLSYDKSLSTDAYKNFEEKKNKDYFDYDENYLKELFDILIIISPLEKNLDYLQDWKPLLQHFHCILLQQGDPNREMKIPEWLEYELHNKQSAESSIKKIDPPQKIDLDLLFDFNINNNNNDPMEFFPAAILNFGFLVADRDFIFILHSQMKPKFQENKNPFELLRIHAYNLLLPTASSSYYNNRVDPFKRKKDFIRGVPYSQRTGMETVMSFGTIVQDNDENERHSYDQMTKLVKDYATKSLHQQNSGTRRSLRSKHEPIPNEEQQQFLSQVEDIHESTTVTISKGMYFTLSFESLAFNRKAIGPIFCLFNGIEQRWKGNRDPTKTNYVNGPYYHILLGWMMKSIFDRIGLGVKHFDVSSYLERISSSSSMQQQKKEQIVKNLENDLLWQEKAESLYFFVTTFRFPNTSASAFSNPQASAAATAEFSAPLGGTSGNNINSEMTIFQAYHELLDNALIRFQFLTTSLLPFFNEIKSILLQYHHLWNLRHDQKTSFLPIAAISSISPSEKSMHKCAAFTITYNDKEFLSIWIRYYLKHFPEQDLFILNHHSTAFQSQDQQRSKDYQIFINKMQETYPALHIIDLYGEKTGFPMYFFIRTADLYQRRLFRYGYKCTIGTDVDEMIVADPEVNPQGLKEYLMKFIEDPTRHYSRAHGWIIGQLSKVIPSASTNQQTLKKLNEQYIDKRFQWDQPIFSQRFYWAIQPKYSKPVLSKIPVRHYPGFHNFYYPKQVKLDKTLLLLHLRDIDADFCLTREYMKAMICQNTSFQSELSKGLSTHLVNYQEKLAKGEVCPYALSKLFVENQTVYDNTMTFVMSRIPEKYQKVIV